jgi:peptidoglycan/xylan/chitin deacetylase (PgdA/CDA1 family)
MIIILGVAEIRALWKMSFGITMTAGLVLFASCARSDQQTANPPAGKSDGTAAQRGNVREPSTISKVGNVQPGLPEFQGGNEGSSRSGVPLHLTPLGKQFSNVLFYKGPANAKMAALTFDDGPDVVFTNQILDILKGQGIKATFFIVGERAMQHPEMVQRIVREGHAVGNHTWDHPNLIKLTSQAVQEEVLRTEQLLQQIVGYRTDLFRPPYGTANAEVLKEISGLGFKIIDWSVDTRDWAGTPSAQIMNYVEKELTPGGIILQHCAGGRNENLSNTVAVLPQIISYLQKNGYTFATVPELLKVPSGL